MWTNRKRRPRDRERCKFSDSISDALALHKRNEVRSDGLSVESLCNRLEIQWRARDVHPWDRELSGKERESAFLRQLMQDAEAALIRLFDGLPELDEIDVIVLDLQAENVLLSGTVQRASFAGPFHRIWSLRMRLAFLGITCHFAADSVVPPGFNDREAARRIA